MKKSQKSKPAAPVKTKKPAKKSSVKARRQELQTRIENVVNGVMTGLNTVSIMTPETSLFRVSSFPYCPILHATNDLMRTENYSSRFYTGIGTEIHELLQHFMPKSVNGYRVFGNWKCSACDKRVDLSHIPKSCACKQPKASWEYVEIEVAYKNLTGHVDKLINVAGTGERPKYIIVDYKSTSLPDYPADKPKKKREKATGDWSARLETVVNPLLATKYPVPYNVDQISAYCALLREVFKLNIVGWALVYVDRSKPITSKSDFHTVSKVWTKKDQTLWMGRIDRACASAEQANKVFGLRREGKTVPGKLLTAVLEARPCRTVAEHDREMGSAFHYDWGKKCEHRDQCTSCGPKELAAYFKPKLTVEKRVP